jgi:hypothetical protein
MRKSIVTSVLALVVLLCASLAVAADLQDRIFHQQKRIDQGIAAGTLTHSEYETIQGNLNWIKETYAREKAEGRLTPEERYRLEKMLDRNSSMILHKKRNPVTRLY